MNIRKFETEMTRIIPSFAGFTEFTTSIPKIYWDVKSQEQRILGICKLLDKVICYADMLGENVDEIAKTLQDIKDGKLDELITAAIEAWFAEHEGQILQDITDLQNRADVLENSMTQLQQAVADETAYREAADNQLASDIGAEMNARKQADAKLDKRTSLHNETFDFVKPFNMKNDKTSFYVENVEEFIESDFEAFTYAGKTLDEIFDPNADWMLYLQPETLSGFPTIEGVNPVAYGECGWDSENGYFTFDSWGNFENSRAYLYWNPLPTPAGHNIGYFAEFECLDYKKGNYGFGTSGAYVYGSNNTGISEIVGTSKVIAEGNTSMGLLFGNLPQTLSVYAFEAPTMRTKAKNLCIIDLTVLLAQGQTDDISGFTNAYQLYCAKKASDSIKYAINIVSEIHAELDDFKAFDNFVDTMNQYAYDMRFVNSDFRSPSGLARYLGSEVTNVEMNNFSCPIDMLKVLLAVGNNSDLQQIMTKSYYPVTFGQGSCKTTVLTPNTMIDPDINLAYKRIYGKGGSENRNATGNYAPYGVLNTITACTLARGRIGYISLFNTPFNSGSGLVTNDLWRYYYCVQRALNQIIAGADPDDITYEADLQNAMNYAQQPTCFAAFFAPPGFDKAAAVSLRPSTLVTWLKEAGVYISNQDGLTEGDTPCITASTAKALTALIAVSECRLDETIQMKDIDYIGGSGSTKTNTSWRTSNLPITLRDAIAAMILYSDNNIANTIARHVGKKISSKAVLGSSFVSMNF